MPPAVVTLMVPVVAPAGTVAVIWVAEFALMAAAVPLNVTLVAPVRSVPVIVTDVPTGPLAAVKLVTVGARTTVKLVELASVPSAVVTLTVPLVAPAGTVAVIWVAEFVPMAAWCR